MNQSAQLLELEAEHERLQTALLARLERENQRLKLKALEAENRRLKLLAGGKAQPEPAKPATGPLVSHSGHPEGFSLCRYDDLIRVRPGLKAQFAPRINGLTRSMAQILSDARKAEAARVRAFCKPKGIWSILKEGPIYTTGRLYQDPKDEERTWAQTAQLVKEGSKWEWTSEVDEPTEGWVQI